jgi:hypothetical protein
LEFSLADYQLDAVYGKRIATMKNLIAQSGRLPGPE